MVCPSPKGLPAAACFLMMLSRLHGSALGNSSSCVKCVGGEHRSHRNPPIRHLRVPVACSELLTRKAKAKGGGDGDGDGDGAELDSESGSPRFGRLMYQL